MQKVSKLARGKSVWCCQGKKAVFSVPKTKSSESDANRRRYVVQKTSGVSTIDELPTERTLGLFWWNSSRDEFNVRFKVESNGNAKREILKTVSSIFDPLGFLVPVTFVARHIMQQTWLQKVDWER